MADEGLKVSQNTPRIDPKSGASLTDLDALIKAIAHLARRDILEWLKQPQKYFPEQHHGMELGVCLGEIARRCGLSQSTVSNHMAQLKRAGLVDMQKAGTFRFFKRNEAAITLFLQSLAQHLEASAPSNDR
ncbi:ArsR/SmtB family transcription factor [Pseudomonas syringae]|uniref:ArsR/SmtB family transcription factor n=1 Tax=Pseudomonas syringae TaxID=317 RepID=UPI001F16C938|nr:metalloregulator ArsR/SmtB family transcription factor [Pseudomonas syringae]MCF5225418.1 helix-turn-helix domain-containing protein [Pseudomonas syringae]MCF5241823.1 helix-turn-helix domain-containing protein [Pseudomonas syringae]